MSAIRIYGRRNWILSTAVLQVTWPWYQDPILWLFWTFSAFSLQISVLDSAVPPVAIWLVLGLLKNITPSKFFYGRGTCLLKPQDWFLKGPTEHARRVARSCALVCKPHTTHWHLFCCSDSFGVCNVWNLKRIIEGQDIRKYPLLDISAHPLHFLFFEKGGFRTDLRITHTPPLALDLSSIYTSDGYSMENDCRSPFLALHICMSSPC